MARAATGTPSLERARRVGNDFEGERDDIGLSAAPAISDVGTGRIYFDSTLSKYRVSESGGAYVDLVAGNAFVDGGNTGFGPVAELGTNDAVPLALKTAGVERARILSTGEFLIGASTQVSNEELLLERNQNAVTQMFIRNTTAGTAAQSALVIRNNTGNAGTFAITSSGFTTSGMQVASQVRIDAGSGHQLMFRTTSAQPILFGTNAIERARLLSTGEFLVGLSAVADSGFVEIENNQNADTILTVRNTTNGTGASARITARGIDVSHACTIGTLPPLFTPAAGFLASEAFLTDNTANAGLIIRGRNDYVRISVGTTTEAVRFHTTGGDNGSVNIGTDTPIATVSLLVQDSVGTSFPVRIQGDNVTVNITGATADGFNAGLSMVPRYRASSAQTVTRHNYLNFNNVLNDANVTITDAAIIRFNAAIGTHLALDTSTGPSDGTLKVNVSGTLKYIDLWPTADGITASPTFTGNLTVSGAANIGGKLTVGGAIDPTQLLLTGADKKLGATDAGTVYLAPFADSTTAVQIREADDTEVVFNVDTLNGRIGIENATGATPQYRLDIGNLSYFAINGSFAHIVQHNSAASTFWSIAPRNGGDFDIAVTTTDPRPTSDTVGTSDNVLSLKTDKTMELVMGASTGFSVMGGVADSQFADVGNVGLGEDTLQTFTLPANALNANGKAIRIRATFRTAANANIKTIKLHFGSTVLSSSGAADINNRVIYFDVIVVRTGASAQRSTAFRLEGVDGAFSDNTLVIRKTPAEDTTTAIVIKGTGETTTNVNNDVIQESMLVEFLN